MLNKILASGRKTKLFLACACVSALSMAFAAMSFATEAETSVDYGEVTKGAGTQISAAVPVALAVVGLFVGIMIAYKLLRRIVRA
jgi:hypothetical protein